MARSPKSTVMTAFTITWFGMIVTALILIYLPHGPARHPKLNAIAILPMAIMSCGALITRACSRNAIIIQVVLFAIALISTVLIANTDSGVGLHPLTCPAVYLVLGAISVGILSATKVPATTA